MNLKDFKELVKSGQKEITLTEDVIFQEGEETLLPILIMDDLIIHGNGHKVVNNHSQMHYPLFQFDEVNLVVSDMTFYYEGGILFKDIFRSNLNLTNCGFHAEGKIIECDFFSRLTLTDCDFEYCVGQIIHVNSTLIRIKNCRFDTEFSTIYNHEGTFEALASEIDGFKDILQPLDYADNSGLFLVLDILPDNYSTFKDLNELISENDGEIILDKDFICGDSKFTDGIEIAQNNLVIDGNNHIINANNKSRIFNISGDNVTLKNIKFMNGTSNDGGAIINTSRNLVFKNCEFKFNCAPNGGAICNLGDNLKVIDCDFNLNYAKMGGALYNNAKHCHICSSSFIDNHANDQSPMFDNIEGTLEMDYIGDGGAICNGEEHSSMHIQKSSFYSNESWDSGSAIDNCGNMEIKECRIESNRTRTGGAIASGGDLKIEKSAFSDNYSKHTEAYNIDNMGSLEIIECEFEDYCYYECDNVVIAITPWGLETFCDDEEVPNESFLKYHRE